MQTVGSRAQVWHNNAHHTSGGLTKKNLFMNKRGRIVSAKKRRTAKKERRLEKAGFFTKKGTFGIVGLTKKRKARRSLKMRKPLRGGRTYDNCLKTEDEKPSTMGPDRRAQFIKCLTTRKEKNAALIEDKNEQTRLHKEQQKAELQQTIENKKVAYQEYGLIPTGAEAEVGAEVVGPEAEVGAEVGAEVEAEAQAVEAEAEVGAEAE